MYLFLDIALHFRDGYVGLLFFHLPSSSLLLHLVKHLLLPILEVLHDQLAKQLLGYLGRVPHVDDCKKVMVSYHLIYHF